MLVWWYLTSYMMEYLSVITVFIDLGLSLVLCKWEYLSSHIMTNLLVMFGFCGHVAAWCLLFDLATLYPTIVRCFVSYSFGPQKNIIFSIRQTFLSLIMLMERLATSVSLNILKYIQLYILVEGDTSPILNCIHS
jgi:hypothetical protein